MSHKRLKMVRFWFTLYLRQALALVDSGVARICCEVGQSCKFAHGALTVNFRAGCSSCSMTNSFVTKAVLIERALSTVVDICIS